MTFMYDCDFLLTVTLTVTVSLALALLANLGGQRGVSEIGITTEQPTGRTGWTGVYRNGFAKAKRGVASLWHVQSLLQHSLTY